MIVFRVILLFSCFLNVLYGTTLNIISDIDFIYLVVNDGIYADSDAVLGEDLLRGHVEGPSSQVNTP